MDLNLIHFFDFYLASMFLASTVLRVRQYRSILGLVCGVPGRWPRLFDLVRQHKAIFLTWSTVWPALLALLLSLVHMLACRLIWPQATVTVERVVDHWWELLLVGVTALLMFGIDLYATFVVGEIDTAMMEKYFDQAEFWLRSWTAPVVKFFTLGYINPLQMVTVEVRKALIEASQLLNTTLWWVNVQVGLRVLFGLTLWLTYAFGG